MPCEHELQIEHTKWLTNIESRAKSNTHRIENLEDMTKTIHDLIAEIRELATNMRTMADNVDDLKGKVDKLEKEDGDKWREFIGHAIKVIIGIVVGVIINKYIGLLG